MNDRRKKGLEKEISRIIGMTLLTDIENEKIEETLDKIEREILTEYSGEIKSSELGDKILSYLIDLDEIAYVRFASVYKKFDSLDSFVKEIEKIRKNKKK